MVDLKLEQANKAISALYKYHNNKSEDKELLVEDNRIFIQLTTHTVKRPGSFYKPKTITLKNALYTDDLEICLITKEDITTTENVIKKNNIPCIKKVISPLMMKTTFKQFEAKRKLAASFDIFFVDDRIYHTVPELLGKSIISSKKPIVPIKTTGNLRSNVRLLLKSTFARTCHGAVHLLNIGHFGMEEAKVLENYKHAVPKFVEHVSESWSTVNIIALRSKQSPLLPIICNLPQAQEETKEETKEKNAEEEKNEDA